MPNTHADKITEIELIYRDKKNAPERKIIRSSRDAYTAFISGWDMNKIELMEQFKVLLLDRKNSCIGVATLATGGITFCAADVRLAFAAALKARATSMIIAHNHPSGQEVFSEMDKRLTKEFFKAGKIMRLPVLDHLLVNKNGYASLADKGLMPSR